MSSSRQIAACVDPSTKASHDVTPPVLTVKGVRAVWSDALRLSEHEDIESVARSAKGIVEHAGDTGLDRIYDPRSAWMVRVSRSTPWVTMASSWKSQASSATRLRPPASPARNG